MIVELDKSEFGKCRGLLHPGGQLEAKAIVEGINPGRIFVDNRLQPETGLIWLGNNDGFLFIGKEDNESFNTSINYFIDSFITEEAKKVHLDCFEAIGNHNKWNKTIEEVFEHRGLGTWNQRIYLLKAERYRSNCEPVLKEDYEVVKIDETLFDNNGAINLDFLHAKILEFWFTPERFLEEGCGYCVVYKREVVSICFSGFVVGNVHGISIETVEAHQGKNLAQKIAHQFVKDCLKNNQVPYWDCMESNKPSIAIAENLGFEKMSTYVGYEFSL